MLAEGNAEPSENRADWILIDDAAGLLTDAEEAEVRDEMEKITEFCHVALYTYGGTSQAAIQRKAQEWYDLNYPGNEECVFFVIDMATRQISVSSTDGIRKTVTVAKSNMITDNVSKLATKGLYAECAKEAFRQIYTTLNGGKVSSSMKYIGNALMAVAAGILLTFLLISARMEQEVKVSLPGVITATAGVGAAIVAKKLTRVVHHESSSGHGGGHGGGGFGGGGGGGGHSMGGGCHGF
jgi:uncharacterized protein